jgi:hypothetical protein
MKDMLKYWLVLSVSTVANVSIAAEEIDCSEVENARERLSCYDQQNPRAPGELSTKTVTPARESTPPTYSEQPTTKQPLQEDQENSADTPAPAEPLRKGSIFDWPEKVSISSTIAAVRRENQKKMVFRLDNDQIWLQTSPRELPIRKGQKVTIKNATVGGFLLRTENGTTTRVQRIK